MEELNKKLHRLLDAAEWTDEEKQWLLWYLDTTDTSHLKDLMHRRFNVNLQQPDNKDVKPSFSMLENIHERIDADISKPRVISLWVKKIAAASVIIFLMAGSFIWWKMNRSDGTSGLQSSLQNNNDSGNHIIQKTSKAVLTLADGSTILLQDAQNGNLVRQGNTEVMKLNGKLSYHASVSSGEDVLFNSIATPRGGQYEVVLPDGSEVWLNAESFIRFPTAFTGSERRVEIEGEAFFKVIKNEAMPFIVKVPNGEVQVLGTHFNIMAYKEEELLKTTLLEGAVKFVSGNKYTTLKPGQQSQLARNGKVNIKNGVNVNEVVAWKNGLFHFERAGIKTIMRQLSRWYNVEVIYENPRLDELFYASIPRKTDLPMALKVLELTGKVHFKTEGKKIIVMP